MGLNIRTSWKLAFALAAIAAYASQAWAVSNAEQLLTPGTTLDAQTRERGAKIYAQHCAGCHEGGATRAPGLLVLSIMAPESILRALTTGVMKPVVPTLSAEERKTVAEFLGQGHIADAAPPPWMCDKNATAFDYSEPPPLSGWGLQPGSSHAIAPAVAGVDQTRLPHLKLKWSLAFPSAVRARSQPAIGGGALYVGSHDGTVFALDRQSGCARWIFHAGAEVRSGVVLSAWRSGDRSAKPMLLFGDLVSTVYALDATTGREIWRVKADPHPSATITGTAVLFEDKFLVPVSSIEEANATDPHYQCCTFRGSLLALDVRTGAKRWQTFTTDAPVERGINAAGAKRFGPSGVAIWSAPTVDAKRRRIYIATGDNYSLPESPLSDAVLALNADTGALVWSYQATTGDAWNTSCLVGDHSNCPNDSSHDYDFGAAPILAKGNDGQQRLLAGQKSGVVYALEPATGKLQWKTKVGRGGFLGGVAFGMSAQDGFVFVPIADYGPEANNEHPIKPGIHALDIRTGSLVWSFAGFPCAPDPLCLPGFSSVPTAIGSLLFAGADNGRLVALNNRTGLLVWEYDTRREFNTVNGEIAKGGSIAGNQGPLAYKGMLFANSGYGFAGKLPGNVLLAFASE